MSYLSVFGLELENTIVILEMNTLKFFGKQSFLQK